MPPSVVLNRNRQWTTKVLWYGAAEDERAPLRVEGVVARRFYNCTVAKGAPQVFRRPAQRLEDAFLLPLDLRRLV